MSPDNLQNCMACPRCKCLMALGLKTCPTCGGTQLPAHYSTTHGQLGNLAADTVLKVLWDNDASHGERWKRISDSEDIEHIENHLLLYSAGDTSEPHIEHAITRMAFILARKGA